MRYFAVVFLAVAASAVPLDFQPTARFQHPALSFEEPESRIVGGQEVPPHQAPYQAGLYMGDIFCGGSLINERYVLTSAQCASKAMRPVVILGAHRIKEKEREQQQYVATKVILHPHWDKFYSDVALVMLPQNIKFTSAIQPIKLAPPGAGSFEGDQVRVTGWGLTSDNDKDLSPVLRFILNPIVSRSVCERKLNVKMFDGQMCLSGEGRRSPCVGDGGAPVIASYQKELVQVGIVSFMVEGACEKGNPVGLTRISYYYNWILASM
ncbi:UNVERIFIED_CONTAM: hypothetical protein PYX00_000156 [Menopon gallinae]|uniref:Peptidase S1 domain-containing protein n=1 Tax=Menopon gallinae TaxID=328185 RepID=A0AAW2I830_9NEOP